MSYRQQLRRDRRQLRRDQGLALLNRKVSEQLEARLPSIAGVAPEASTPVNPPESGVS